MAVVIIVFGLIGVTYLTGNALRKQKMRKIGSQIFEVIKETIGDFIILIKNLFYKIKKNWTRKNTSKWR